MPFCKGPWTGPGKNIIVSSKGLYKTEPKAFVLVCLTCAFA